MPSFAFVTFGSASDRRLAGWTAFRDSILTATAIGDVPPVLVSASTNVPPPVGIWRLLASNNRELARSWVSYPSCDAARADVTRLQSAVSSLAVTVVRGRSASHYGWFATLDGVPVISSGRWFGALSTSAHSAATTLADFAHATV